MNPGPIAPARGWQLSHRDDDQPCGCDDCMELQAEDAGVAWWRLPKADRERLRRNSSGDDRLAAIAPARGIAWGLLIAAFLWVAILGGLAMIVTLLLS